ncbi:sensor histidine kinase [Paenibacillus montanisoli]|uniref:histidine kinase n=1 Tax=Paenibacillus montanisoli TaxID=2081970 RepID=A0A328TSE0_9BACL|nr:sensor histidine kinase [Paenibacillus montanisoli]RAP73398.1 sensor histidine kinase [Paenibacillus montanisoli]
MFLIRLILRTLDSERKALAVYLLNAALLILIFNLMLDTVSIVYPVCVSLAVFIVYFARKAYALHGFLESLDEAKAPGDYTYAAESAKERQVFAAIEDIHAAYHDKLAALHDKLEGRNSLFSQFVHNMKSSLAVIELASAKTSLDAMSDIALENEKLKANMEQVLNLLRLDEFSNDYVPERVDLMELVQAVINDNRRAFIYAGVYPKLNGKPADVYTDRKWCAYMLDQIVTNAIKYSGAGKSVYFEIESGPGDNRVSVRIRDEGEGIDPEDMPRVFELFFTGRNGRANKNATGIGLAMVKHIAKRLGHEVSLTSAFGEGTCVTVSFLSKLKAY